MASAEQMAVRRAVHDALAGRPGDAPVLVACSGGADSVALAAATAAVCARDGRPAGGVTVDHGLQAGSAGRARTVATMLVGLGFDPVEVVHVDAGPPRQGRQGPEGNARLARYAALDAAARRHAASAVLLGHTRDDQAETVLLGLARGSGGRSLAGMPAATGRYLRPLLALPREEVRKAVPAGLPVWEDPHNADAAYARARVRHRVLPTMEAELGPGVSAALARTAELLRADADALDGWAERAHATCVIIGRSGVADPGTAGVHRLRVEDLLALPAAVRHRILRRAAIGAGSPATDLTAAHVLAVDALLTRWRGQRGVDLPGKVRAARSGLVLSFGPPADRV